jgi:hypothetical protein
VSDGRGRLGGLEGLLGSKIGPTPGRLVTGLLGLLGSKIGPTSTPPNVGLLRLRLKPVPVSVGLGFGVLLSGLVVLVRAVRRRRTLGLFGFGIPLPSPDIFGLLKPVPVSVGLGFGIDLGPAVALALRRVSAIAFCLEVDLRNIIYSPYLVILSTNLLTFFAALLSLSSIVCGKKLVFF